MPILVSVLVSKRREGENVPLKPGWKRLKRIPRTVEDEFVGSCGHAFRERVSLPGFQVGTGEPATKGRWDAVLSVLARVRETALLSPCPACTAAACIHSERSGIERLALVAERPCPPPMDGPIGQVAFAETVRAECFWSARSEELLCIRKAMGVLTPGLSLLTRGMAAVAAEYHIDVGLVPSPDLVELGRQLEDAVPPVHRWSYLGQLDAPASLAWWLLMREEWSRDTYRSYWAPRQWIAQARRREGIRPGPMSPTAAHTAVLVASLGGWKDRYEAQAAFDCLSDVNADTVDAVWAMAAAKENRTWGEVFNAVSVWRSLATPPVTDESPF